MKWFKAPLFKKKHRRSVDGYPCSGTAFDGSCVLAARMELERPWCEGVVSKYSGPDEPIVTMTFAAFVLFLMHRAFADALPRDVTANGIREVMQYFRTHSWYHETVFAAIAEQVNEHMPKALSQGESAGTSLVDLIECANACGYSLLHQTDIELMYGFEFGTVECYQRMKLLANSYARPPSR